jgi:hypothetical protein
MTERVNRQDYLKEFSGERQREALTQALDIRKFEIELYWKRAVYFWTFIAAAFAGYFALAKDGQFDSIYVVTCLGFLFSLSWYCVNRGSSAWQRNWEAHVDLLEDEIMGPLHKTVINRRTYKLHRLTEPFAFSPSRINNILSFSVTLVWLLLIAKLLLSEKAFSEGNLWTTIAMTVLVVALASILLWKGRTDISDGPISVEVRKRKYL